MLGLSTYGLKILALLASQKPWEYAPSVYRQDGSIIPHEDDVRDLERSYFEAFVCRDTALEIERRLRELEEFQEHEVWGAKRPEFKEKDDE